MHTATKCWQALSFYIHVVCLSLIRTFSHSQYTVETLGWNLIWETFTDLHFIISSVSEFTKLQNIPLVILCAGSLGTPFPVSLYASIDISINEKMWIESVWEWSLMFTTEKVEVTGI
jgi:hypothetical protein